MADPTALVEQREAFAAKQKRLTSVLEMAGKDLDFSRDTVLRELGVSNADDAFRTFTALNKEIEHDGADLRRAEAKHIAALSSEREAEMKQAATDPVHIAYEDSRKSWGQQYVESKEFKASKAGRLDIPWQRDIALKTLFQTSAGFAIENVRSGLLVEKATRPIQVTDLIPSFPISQAAFVYMEETTRTHAGVETAEAGSYPESTFAWTQRTSTVQKIADSIPVTDEQLEDASQVQSLLEQRLAFGLRQRLDRQIMIGDGISPNLLGLINKSGIQTQAKGGDNYIVAFMKALTLLRFTGRCNPSGAIFHPTDWQSIVLSQNANGDFLFGNPFQGPGPQSLLGIPVAQCDALTQGTGVVADLANFTRLDDRRGVMVQTGYVTTQFTDGKVTLRADMRAAFTITRAAAVCTITGL